MSRARGALGQQQQVLYIDGLIATACTLISSTSRGLLQPQQLQAALHALQLRRLLVSLSQAKRVKQLQQEAAAARKRLSKLQSTHGGLLAEAQQTQEDLQDVQEELLQVGHALGCTHVTLDLQRMQHAQFPARQHSACSFLLD